MTLFRKLKALRESHKASLPAIQTPTDLDIVLAVGVAQDSNLSIETRDLLSANLGIPATIGRRLERLKRLRVIEQRLTVDDGCRRHLVLSAFAYNRVETYLRAVQRALAR